MTLSSFQSSNVFPLHKQTIQPPFFLLHTSSPPSPTHQENVKGEREEIRKVGHGDLKHEPWWPRLATIDELLHATINFGQYPYGGPAMIRRFLPLEDTDDYEELERDPEKAFLKTVKSHWQTVLGITLIEILSKHTADEVYLGQADMPEWTTSDGAVLEAFGRFGVRLREIEARIEEMNNDNRWKMPYTLLYPSSDVGLTGMGVPNSVSI